MAYKQLTYEQRCQIKILWQEGFSLRKVALKIEVAPGTVSRELKRNGCGRGYNCNLAHKWAVERQLKARTKPNKLKGRVLQEIKTKLTKEQWSPEQISGYLEKEDGVKISAKTIYSYIWKDRADGGMLYLHLRHSKKKRKPYGKACKRQIIKDRVPIEKRPKIAEEMGRVGDFEIDTIIGKNHKGAIVSIVDRKSKITLLAKINRKTANLVGLATTALLRGISGHTHTITSDNGTEFAGHKEIAKALDAKFYFARPYASWQRGLNENTNGLVRQYVPKKTNFDEVTDDDILMIMRKLNNRPRKCLGFKTPNQVFFEATGAVIG